MNDCLGNMQATEQEERVTVRQKMASDNGFTGVSLLNRLNMLYDFDVLKDMVFDTMHTLILRVALRHLQLYKECGLFGNPMVEKRLEKMPWTAGYFLVAVYAVCMHLHIFIVC